jgi:hypothetical protein
MTCSRVDTNQCGSGWLCRLLPVRAGASRPAPPRASRTATSGLRDPSGRASFSRSRGRHRSSGRIQPPHSAEVTAVLRNSLGRSAGSSSDTSSSTVPVPACCTCGEPTRVCATSRPCCARCSASPTGQTPGTTRATTGRALPTEVLGSGGIVVWATWIVAANDEASELLTEVRSTLCRSGFRPPSSPDGSALGNASAGGGIPSRRAGGKVPCLRRVNERPSRDRRAGTQERHAGVRF